MNTATLVGLILSVFALSSTSFADQKNQQKADVGQKFQNLFNSFVYGVVPAKESDLKRITQEDQLWTCETYVLSELVKVSPQVGPQLQESVIKVPKRQPYYSFSFDPVENTLGVKQFVSVGTESIVAKFVDGLSEDIFNFDNSAVLDGGLATLDNIKQGPSITRARSMKFMPDAKTIMIQSVYVRPAKMPDLKEAERGFVSDTQVVSCKLKPII